MGLPWAELLAALRAAGRAMPVKDSLIAATALSAGLTVVTLNRRDFEVPGSPSSIQRGEATDRPLLAHFVLAK
ncbi:MAG TPA: hypothetical protein VLZ06_00225 [Solirubrobacteraceae bacterium]|nr:hypothetical protein [Solirubrobacteraceae bacterium]